MGPAPSLSQVLGSGTGAAADKAGSVICDPSSVIPSWAADSGNNVADSSGLV
jgi:hypothetical protein